MSSSSFIFSTFISFVIYFLLKQAIQKTLPKQIFEGLRTMLKGSKVQTDDEYFVHNQPDSWLIRVLAKKTNSKPVKK